MCALLVLQAQRVGSNGLGFWAGGDSSACALHLNGALMLGDAAHHVTAALSDRAYHCTPLLGLVAAVCFVLQTTSMVVLPCNMCLMDRNVMSASRDAGTTCLHHFHSQRASSHTAH